MKLALLKGSDGHPLEGAFNSTVVDDVVPVDNDYDDGGDDGDYDDDDGGDIDEDEPSS